MSINEIISEKGLTKYKLAILSGVPHTTLNDICNGKTRIEKSSAETVHKLSHALWVTMESLDEPSLDIQSVETERERSYEYGLPEYLQHDLDAYKEAIQNGSSLSDCSWGELYGSINIAEINDGIITHEHADYLRDKYLRGKDI